MWTFRSNASLINPEKPLRIFNFFEPGASFFLMLGHVPLWNVVSAAVITYERPDSLMFSQVHFQIWPCIVFFCAALKTAVEFINILMSFLMISQNPILSIRLVASRDRAGKLLNFWFFMSCCVVGEMLRHFETFIAVGKGTFVNSDW